MLMLYGMLFHNWEATDSCGDGWNVRNGSNILKILYSVDKRVDCVLLIVVALLLSKDNNVPLNLNKKRCECLRCGDWMNLLMLLWKAGYMGCLLCQNLLVINRKNGCLSCFICTQWNQSFYHKPLNWLLTL